MGCASTIILLSFLFFLSIIFVESCRCGNANMMEKMLKFILPVAALATAEKFATGFVKHRSYALRSQAPPEKEEANGTVKTVVGSTFNQIVNDPNRDVFILFYAPWCVHCTVMFPAWEGLASKMKDEDSITIAKMDATANDYPSDIYPIKGYPTMYFVPAHDKKRPIQYKGGRSFDGFVNFVHTNATLNVKDG